MNRSASSRRRLLSALGAGIVGAGLFLAPTAAFAETVQTVQTTDKAGDARAGLRNQPTADLLAAGARFGPSTVTAFFDLGAAPTQAQLADATARGLPYGGRYDYTSTFTFDNGPGIGVSFHDDVATLGSGGGEGNEPTPACAAYFGDTGPRLQSPVVADTATGELRATFSRADVDAAQSCFGSPPFAGTVAVVTDASSDIQTAYKNPLVGGVIARDTAGQGPGVTLAN